MSDLALGPKSHPKYIHFIVIFHPIMDVKCAQDSFNMAMV